MRHEGPAGGVSGILTRNLSTLACLEVQALPLSYLLLLGYLNRPQGSQWWQLLLSPVPQLVSHPSKPAASRLFSVCFFCFFTIPSHVLYFVAVTGLPVYSVPLADSNSPRDLMICTAIFLQSSLVRELLRDALPKLLSNGKIISFKIHEQVTLCFLSMILSRISAAYSCRYIQVLPIILP